MPERARRNLLAVQNFLHGAFPGAVVVAHDSFVTQVPAQVLLHVELDDERLILCIVSELLAADDPEVLVDHLRQNRVGERLRSGEPCLIVRTTGVERFDPQA
jgi:hypothetical protein